MCLAAITRDTQQSTFANCWVVGVKNRATLINLGKFSDRFDVPRRIVFRHAYVTIREGISDADNVGWQFMRIHCSASEVSKDGSESINK